MTRKVKPANLAKATGAGSRAVCRNRKPLQSPAENSAVTTLPKIPTSTLKGMVRPLKRTVSIAEMDDAIERGVCEKYRRSQHAD